MRVGDKILAFQSNRNELVGIARVVALKSRGGLFLSPIRRIGLKVKPLKSDRRIAAIPAFQRGPIRTLYPIDKSDAQVLLRIADLRLRLERDAAKQIVSAKNGTLIRFIKEARRQKQRSRKR